MKEPTSRTHIVVRSRYHDVGNHRHSFAAWGDIILLSSYSDDSWPFVIVSFYYRLSEDDNQRHHLNYYCYKVQADCDEQWRIYDN